MAVFSAIASIIAVGAGIAGTALNYIGAKKAAAGAERAEKLRERQMNLTAAREKRSTVRQAIIARSQALSNSTAQNAAEGSGAQAGMGNVVSQAGSNIQGITQGQQIGTQMFDAQRQISRGQTQQSMGSAIAGFGDLFAQNRDIFSRVWGTP